MSSLFACFQKGGRIPPLPICFRALLCLHGRRPSFFFVEPPKLSDEEQETLLLLRQFHPEVDLAYDLVQQFAQMLRERLGKRLDPWLAQVNQSNIPELLSFAA